MDSDKNWVCSDVFRGRPCCLTGPGKKNAFTISWALVKSSHTLRPMVLPKHTFSDTNQAENTIPTETEEPIKTQLYARWALEWCPGVLLMED